ncbi:MAG: hypothetical protein K2X93_01895 [Candidatus Obscuribacterales bacterium]|nr:hypothetical protein [Candidatus Obscuribacterales bacterium]
MHEVTERVMLNDHLSEGDIFSIFGFNGDGVFRVTKLVKVRANCLHLFVYDGEYSKRPADTELDSVIKIPVWIDSQLSREMSLPVSRKLFSLMRPVYMGTRPLDDMELNGYRQWCLTGGGEIVGSHVSLDDEIDKNSRVYGRIFFSFSMPSFLSSGLYFLAYSVKSWLLYSVLTGIAFGAIMVILQWGSIRRYRHDTLRKISASSIQFHEIEMTSSYNEAFELGVRALSDIKSCHPILIDRKGGTIEGRVRSSLMEDGQEILLVFHKSESGPVGCVVWSESIAGTTTVDMGRNLLNVNTIISHLKSSSASKEPFSMDVVDNKAAKPESKF